MTNDPYANEPWGKPCEVCDTNEGDHQIHDDEFACADCRCDIWEAGDDAGLIPEEDYAGSMDGDDDYCRTLFDKLQVHMYGERKHNPNYASQKLSKHQVKILQVLEVCGRMTEAEIRVHAPGELPSRTKNRLRQLYNRGLLKVSPCPDLDKLGFTLTDEGTNEVFTYRAANRWKDQI